MSKVLVLSPHPDDESIGCGGALRKHIMEGDTVEVIFLTSGERGGHGMSKEETKIVREKEALRAAAILGYKRIEFWNIPNGKLKATKNTVKRLADKIARFRPQYIYVTHDKEMHPEHRAAALMVKRAIPLVGNLKKKPLVYMYEVWTPIQKMDHIVDISPYVKIKIAAIRAHKSQCRVMDFDTAILALNRYRGEMHSWPGGDFAEVFSIYSTKRE